MAPRENEMAFLAEEVSENVSYMAEEQQSSDDEGADAQTASEEGGDDKPEAVAEEKQTSADGWQEFSSDLVQGDEDDKKNMEEKFFKKTKVNCRGRVHNFCDGMEIAADLMLTDALLNKSTRAKVLDARQKLLYSLWRFRDTADCEDDFDQDEFHSEMRVLAVIQRKLMSLDIKVDAINDGGDSSSDTEGDGEKDNLQKLKFARQTLRYAMGKGSIPAA